MQSSVRRQVVWLLTILLCAAGAYVSFELSRRHIQGGFGADSLLGRMCEEGTASCDEVIKSRWGTFHGIPTAVWGLIYFTGVGLWCLLVGLPNRAGRWWQLLPIAGTLIGLGIAAYLDYVMFAKLPSWCPLCLVTHIASLLLFVTSILMWPRKGEAARPVQAPGPQSGQPGSDSATPPLALRAEASPRPGRVILASVAILISAALVHQNFLNRYHRAEKEKARQTLAEWAAAGTQPVPTSGPAALTVRAGDPVTGDPNAPNTLVVFSDFECPVCGGFANFWHREILPYAPGKVRLVYRYFPMNTKCNRALGATVHELSCEAAEIAEAARLQGGNDAFWKMHDELFINQLRGKKRLRPDELAKKVGLDPARLEQDLKSPRVRERIAQDVDLAARMGVKGTPAVFLNGQRVQTTPPDPVWQRFLASLRPSASAPAVAATEPAAGCAELRAALAECQKQIKPVIEDWQSLLAAFLQEKVVPLALRPDDPAKGSPKARRTIVAFCDFECPRSLEFTSYWLARVEPYVGNSVRFVFRYYPSNTACNPIIDKTKYPDSCKSAAAAEAARLQGGNDAFWKMHDELFENQIRKAPLTYAQMAARIGLDPARLAQDMDSPRVRARIQQDISFAQQAGVTTTPAVFLNGRPVPVWWRHPFWQNLLDFRSPLKPGTTSAPAAPRESRGGRSG